MNALLYLLSAADDLESPASPIYQAITLIGPYALAVITMLCMFYGIFIGVKYAKTDDAEGKKKLQKTIVNFVIGAISIYILIGILYAIRPYV